MMHGNPNGMELETAAGHLRQAVIRFLTPRSLAATLRDEELVRQGTTVELACGLAATSWGEGPTVLMAHGWESRRTHWGSFIPALTAAGFRVVAIDAPAHGDSPGDQVSVFDYAQSLIKVGSQLGPLAGVVGHSFGAAAAAIALHLGLNSACAVLISGPVSLSAVIERWGRHHQMDEAQIPMFVTMVAQQTGVPLEKLDLALIVKALKQPALIIHDRGDDDIPVSDAETIAGAWPGSRLLITDRYGHRRVLIAKEIVRAVVGFVTKQA